jgi:hypothetical protein
MSTISFRELIALSKFSFDLNAVQKSKNHYGANKLGKNE